MPSIAENRAENRRIRVLIIGLALTLAILVVYWQVQDHEFLIWDDDRFITENPKVRAGLTLDGLAWAFSVNDAEYWLPLTWLSHMLDVTLYGLNPKAHHFNTLLFHLANTLLLFLVLMRMTGAIWRSALVAALFALHPLRVESVAWATERKDVLSTFFWMITLWAYHRHVRQPGTRSYLVALLSFALGLMAKPTLVTLPFVLFLIDYWPLGRIRCMQSRDLAHPATTGTIPFHKQGRSLVPLVLEKIPFILLASFSSLLTFYAARGIGSVPTIDALPLRLRIANATVSYVKYMGKLFWPADLAFFYPHPLDTLPTWQVAGSFLLLGCLSLLVIVQARRYPYLLTGWLWYLGTLVPLIGFIQVGTQAMADRFTYVPHIGLALIAVWGIADVLSSWPYRRIFFTFLSTLTLSSLALCTWFEVRYWKDSVTLFERAIQVTSDNYIAHHHLGNALARQGRPNEAINHYAEAIRIKPDHYPSRHNLGNELVRQGKLSEAISQYSEALKFNPRSSKIHYSLGNAFSAQGRFDEAISSYSEALRIDPGNGIAHNDLGYVLLRMDRPREAMRHFSEALRINPGDRRARHNLDLVLKRIQGSDALEK